MSIPQTKTALIAALQLPETPVVALHGPWGSGKTYLWREIEKEFGGKNTLYISCMAYGSVVALKSATIAALLSRKSEAAKYGETAFGLIVGYINTKLPEELRLNASLSDLQAFLPTLKSAVAGKTLLVFDDIERATELNIHELLGFISFLVDQLGIQILLILNKEKLGGRLDAWEQLREKIISMEIALDIDAEDCVAIGLGQMPKEHFALFSDRIKRLKITNIRALQHMKRIYNALSIENLLDDSHWPQLIPSLVLHVALHLGVIDNVSAVEQALNKQGLLGYDKKDLTEDEQKARDLLADYDVGTPDDFENEILLPYLRTGYLDTKSIADYVSEIALRRQRRDAEIMFDDFMYKYYWDATTSPSGLLALIEQVRSRLSVLNAEHATKLAKLANELERPDLANAIVADWIELHKSWLSALEMNESFFDFPDEFEVLHPTIQNAYKVRYQQLYPPLSLHESVEYILTNSSWESRQIRPFENASQDEFEELIRTAAPRQLARVLRFLARTAGRPGVFKAPSDRFAAACRAILEKEPDSRLSSIIKRAFSDWGMRAVLERSSADVANDMENE